MAGKSPEISYQNNYEQEKKLTESKEKPLLDEEIFKNAVKYSQFKLTNIFLDFKSSLKDSHNGKILSEEIFSDKSIFDIEGIKKSFKDYIETEWSYSNKKIPEGYDKQINDQVIKLVNQLIQQIKNEIINTPNIASLKDRLDQQL